MQQVAVTLNRNLLALAKNMKKSCFEGDRFLIPKGTITTCAGLLFPASFLFIASVIIVPPAKN